MRIDVLVSGGGVERLAGRDVRVGENPGIGGTQWTSLDLAERLARSGSVDVRVVFDGDYASPRLAVARSVMAPGFDPSDVDPADVTVVSAATAEVLDPAWRRRRLVVTIHHPHYRKGLMRVLDRRNPTVLVSVGQYAWHSTRARGVPHHWLPNPFPRWALPGGVSRTPRPGSPPTFGFVGALTPAKGFHLVAEAWPTLSERMPGARLEVIGAATLHGLVTDHPTIPTNAEYGDQILGLLGGSARSVHFHGLVAEGKADLMRRWDVALLNPTGETEADPSSLKEVLVAGVLPVTSSDFGMWDLMRHFPELTLRSPNRLPEVAIRAATDEALRSRFEARRSSIIEAELARDDALDDAWIGLLRAVAQDDRRALARPRFRPARPRGRVGLRLVLRRDPLRRWLKRARKSRSALRSLAAGRTAGRAGRRP